MTHPDESASPPSVPQKRWWSRLGRRAADAVVASESQFEDNPSVPPSPEQESERPHILRMSPFSIGFFGTLGALTAVVLALSMQKMSNIILIVVVSLFLALGLNPIVEFFMRRGLRRWLAVALVAFGLLGVMVLGSWALIPVLTDQAEALRNNFPSYVTQIQGNQTISRLDEKYKFIHKIQDFLKKPDAWTNTFDGIWTASKVVLDTMISSIITLVLTLYFLASLPAIKNAIYGLAPRSRRPRVKYLANEIFRRIGSYLTGMFVVITCSSVCSFIMMQFVGLTKYALALAFVVALFAFIPLVGTLCSMTIVALVALSVSPLNALIVIIYFIIYMQIEAYFIQPRVMSRSVAVPGAVVVVAALSGAALLGVVGALIAIPSAAAVLILYREVLVPHLEQT